nr:zinc finger BED domain-containing protein 5-like [Parasteatoda tepidariorum]
MASKKHSQMYRKEYSVEWPVFSRSTKSMNHVYCNICKCDFSIAHGGRNDCLRHVEGSRHRANGAASSSSKSIRDMFSSSSKESQSVIKAETLFTNFIVQHNLPLSVADHVGQLFKRMFPDSNIAAKFKCARKKTTEICKSLAETTQNNLCSIMRNGKFSLATDGSNSSGDKLFPLVVTFFDDTNGRIKTTLFSLPKLDKDGTGENIFMLLDSVLSKNSVPWEHCIAFCADNASVMLGQHKGVGSFIKKKNPNVIIHGCACHLIHLAAKHATKKISFDVESFLIDVFYYLKKSSKRIQLLKFCEELCNLENSKVLKYGATRWLSMGKTIDRFLEKWDALKIFFCEEEKGSSETFKKLKTIFEDKSTQLYLFFLQSVIPLFESCNTMMQQQAPLIHRFQRELMNLFSNILSRFIKPACIANASSVFEVNFNKSKNQKDDSELVIGGKTRQYIKDSDLSSEEMRQFYSSIRKFYTEALSYILKKFPLTTEVYKHCEVADITIRHEAKFASLDYFLSLFFVSEEKRSQIEQEFALYQMDKLNEEILSAERCDTAWTLISGLVDMNGARKYEALPSIMLTILILPHSNAACERVFSIVKKNLTDSRSSLALPTLEALLIEKCKSSETCCYDAVLTEQDLIKAKKATYVSLTGEKV